MSNGRGLPRGPGVSGSGGSRHVARGAATDEPPADLPGDLELATSEGSRPGDRVPGAAVVWSFRLERPQHPLRAVRRPPGDNPPVAFAQRLRRAHRDILPTLTTGERCSERNTSAPDSRSSTDEALRRIVPA